MSCQAVKLSGDICGKNSSNGSYFWFRDNFRDYDKIIHLCQDCANKILGSLMYDEIQEEYLIKKLDHKVKSLVKSHTTYTAESREIYRKLKVLRDHKNNIRNKTCRWCCYSLKQPNDPLDQQGKQYSHATFHTGSGHGRAWILFHTECAVSWLAHATNIDTETLKVLRPKLVQQETLI